MRAPANLSLKVSLTRRLVVGLLVMGIIGAAVAYSVSTRFANRSFDRTLFDDVKVLANQVRWVEGSTRVTLSPDALIWLLADEGDDVIFRVTDLGAGRLLTSNGDLGALPDLNIRPDEPYFRSVSLGAERLRVAYVRKLVGPGNASALVEIGETTRKREGIAGSILIGTVSMMSVFILVAVALVWTGVGSALSPLRALEADAAQRSVGDLQPLDARSAPAEVLTLIEAFNHMIARVAQAIDVQRQFLANAAHQLKTPMAGLRLQAQLALTADSLGAAHENMRSVEHRAAHSAHLIDQLLSLAQAEAGESGLPSARCDLAEVAEAVIERMLPEARERRVDLGFESAGSAMVVLANPVLIGELMTNLVDNALRYGRMAGRVTVRLEHVAERVTLKVIDDGPGFPAETRELVFRRFWRSDSSVGDGAGLGLAIVREIAERYRAAVSIVSRPEIEGTRIEVAFAAA